MLLCCQHQKSELLCSWVILFFARTPFIAICTFACHCHSQSPMSSPGSRPKLQTIPNQCQSWWAYSSSKGWHFANRIQPPSQPWHHLRIGLVPPEPPPAPWTRTTPWAKASAHVAPGGACFPVNWLREFPCAARHRIKWHGPVWPGHFHGVG